MADPREMPPKRPRSAVVVVVDRLGTGFLGPYGNTWLDTPQCNLLASQSLLCETVLADSPELSSAYRGYWTARHTTEPEQNAQVALPRYASSAGLRTVLLTDESSVSDHAAARGFGETIVVPCTASAGPAEELDQTGIGRLFLAAIELVQNTRDPALVWIHSRGMSGAWDAPAVLRQQFADDDDPTPPDFVEPPNLVLPDPHDPDELLGIVHAYAGQVSLLDACLGSLVDALDASPLGEQALLAFTSPRGYPLGEHRLVGSSHEALYAELLHVPLLLRFSDRLAALERTHRLLQPADLGATLADWLGQGMAAGGFAASLLPLVRGEEMPRRELLYSTGRNQRAIRTPAWFLRQSEIDESTGTEQPRFELFAKPDDRWEVHEVASRGGEVVPLLTAARDRFEQSAAAGQLAESPPLAQALCDVRR
ncbi:MAG: sulfatase-like hydrolase/transferase [Pirellulaceae bacterium]